MKINVKYHNKIYEYEKGTSLYDISKDFISDYPNGIIAASINNRISSMSNVINKDTEVNFFDPASDEGRKVYERGLLFLFTKAVKDVLNCDTKLLYIMQKGIYCEILDNELISEVTAEKIKIRMRELSDLAIPINKIIVSRTDAIDYYEKINRKDKSETLKYISNSSVSLYRMDNALDYYYGVLPYNTKQINKYSIKFIKDNKLMLSYPYLFVEENDGKIMPESTLMDEVEKNDEYQKNININASSDLNKIISTGKYNDLIKLSESVQDNRLFQISSEICKNKDTKLVLICGPTSSGKTTISKKLALFLKSKGYNPIPVSIDDFFIDIKERPLNEKGEPELERINAVDTEQFNDKISKLLNGEEVTLPRYDFIMCKQVFDKDPIKMDDKSILIVEGIHAFNEKLTEMIPDKNKLKMFIAPITPLNIDNHNLFKEDDNRLLRRIIRDNVTRGYSASNTLNMWKNVRNAEEKFIFPYIKEADIIFNTSLIYELGVLKTYAEPLLFSVSKDDPEYDEAIRLINMFRVILGIPSEGVPNDSIIREFIGGSSFN